MGQFSPLTDGSSLRFDDLIELLAGEVAQLQGGFAQAAVLDVGGVGDLGRLVVADLGVSAVTSISEFLT